MGSIYSLSALLQKEPAVIAGAVRTVLYVLILAGVLHWEAALLAGVALAMEVVLTLFVRGNSTGNANVNTITSKTETTKTVGK